MLTLSMLRRFTAFCAVAVVVASTAVASRPEAHADLPQQAAQDSNDVMAKIMSEAHDGNLVVSREVDGRIVIDAISSIDAPRRDDVRMAALP